MRKLILTALVVAAPAFSAEPNSKVVASQPTLMVATPAPKIQLAILLDTSNSMDGLINQTREQLWKIVNTFSAATRDGVRPSLELALYEYGNDGLPVARHYMRRVVPLTTDVDRVSEALFALKTNGGSEYCGAVIAQAAQELEWSADSRDLKLIYIAGNEPFTQGPVSFKEAIAAAKARGVIVNTIHAGTEAEGIGGRWRDGAMLAHGDYLFIDSNRAVARVSTPQDAELARLSAALNDTYVTYGATGKESKTRQEAQDKNAGAMSPSSLSTRATAKASSAYKNESWDLVDAQKGSAELAAMPVEQLPTEMRAMSADEKQVYVEKKRKQRAEIKEQIQKLSQAREAYVQREMAKKPAASSKTLDDALIESAKKQGTAAAFAF